MKDDMEFIHIKGSPYTKICKPLDYIVVNNILFQVINKVWSDSNGDAIFEVRYIGENEVPSKSKKQAKLMAAAAHSPEFAKKVGVKLSVAKEFNEADAGTGILKKNNKAYKKGKRGRYK